MNFIIWYLYFTVELEQFEFGHILYLILFSLHIFYVLAPHELWEDIAEDEGK